MLWSMIRKKIAQNKEGEKTLEVEIYPVDHAQLQLLQNIPTPSRFSYHLISFISEVILTIPSAASILTPIPMKNKN